MLAWDRARGSVGLTRSETAARVMERRWTMTLALFAVAATVLFTGCATIGRSQAPDTEQLLAAAGFKAQLANATDTQQGDATPPYRLVRRVKDGAVQYTYADPGNCGCVYVGGPKEYSEYQRLATERRIARERLWADKDPYARWDYWGGGTYGVWE